MNPKNTRTFIMKSIVKVSKFDINKKMVKRVFLAFIHSLTTLSMVL